MAGIGTPNLAFVCMGLLSISILLMKLAWRWREITADSKGGVHPAAEPEHSFRIIGQVFSHIRHSKHLSLILAVVGITFMVVQIAEFQFVAFASERNTSTDDLTGFLGFWLSSVSIFALFFQIGFANLIIRRFGVGVTILFLPIALLLSSALLLMSYSFVTILSLKFADRAFRHSINRVGSELLFLPIPQEIKKETKAFVDMFGDRFARGLAGLLLIVFYSWLGLSVSQISLVSIVLILLWIVISMAAYREYVDAFRQALAKRRLDPELISVSITDEATINSLIISLGSRNTRQVVYALGLLETVEGVDLVPAIRPLLQHRSPEIRFSTLQLIRRRGETELQSDAEKLLHDEDENVQREAVRFFAEFSKGPVVAKLKEWLHHEDRGLRGAAVYYMAKNPKLAKKLLKPELVQSFLKGDEQERRHIAAALGVLKNESYFPYLHKLLQDPVHTVQVEAIKSAGQTRARDFVPILVQHLDHRDCRLAAAAALALHGDSIIETLIGYFCDDDISINIRMRIPRVIMLVGSQKSAEVLLENIEQQNQ
ncbi:MAG: HEAT repeat domain-containing protein, partial [bacterium]